MKTILAFQALFFLPALADAATLAVPEDCWPTAEVVSATHLRSHYVEFLGAPGPPLISAAEINSPACQKKAATLPDVKYSNLQEITAAGERVFVVLMSPAKDVVCLVDVFSGQDAQGKDWRKQSDYCSIDPISLLKLTDPDSGRSYYVTPTQADSLARDARTPASNGRGGK